jgi:hypothetical protein
VSLLLRQVCCSEQAKHTGGRYTYHYQFTIWPPNHWAQGRYKRLGKYTKYSPPCLDHLLCHRGGSQPTNLESQAHQRAESPCESQGMLFCPRGALGAPHPGPPLIVLCLCSAREGHQPQPGPSHTWLAPAQAWLRSSLPYLFPSPILITHLKTELCLQGALPATMSPFSPGL